MKNSFFKKLIAVVLCAAMVPVYSYTTVFASEDTGTVTCEEQTVAIFSYIS